MGDSAIPRWRTAAAWVIRGAGIALGAALAGIYLALLWDAPPQIDWPHARLRSVAGLYLVTPALLFGGSVWIFGFIAGFVAPRSDRKKDKETDT